MRASAWLFLFLLAFPVPSRADDLDALYTRIASDLRAGEPLRVSVYVALCDNDSQGIVKVKNPAICYGEDPARNLYWGTSGGLFGFARKHGYALASHERGLTGDVIERAVFQKRLQPGPALRARGVHEPFMVALTGIAYRGERIGEAMHAFVRAVHEDDAHAPHVVGYIGHDWVLDIESTASLAALSSGTSTLEKGTFALSCLGDRYLRPLIARDNARILALNKSLTYPGAWTVGGMIDAIAQGQDAAGIVRLGAQRFAEAMGKSPGAIARGMAYGN